MGLDRTHMAAKGRGVSWICRFLQTKIKRLIINVLVLVCKIAREKKHILPRRRRKLDAAFCSSNFHTTARVIGVTGRQPPVMSVKSLFGVLMTAVFFVSCGERRSKQQLAVINDGFERAQRFIVEMNESIFRELQNREFDPTTAADALPWAPTLKKIRSLTKHLDFYLDSINAPLFEGSELSETAQIELSVRLKAYKTAVIGAFDSVLASRSDHAKKDLLALYPTLPLWEDSALRHVTPPITFEILNKLRIDIQLAEYGWRINRDCFRRRSI